jgi:salicylate hydroxylase
VRMLYHSLLTWAYRNKIGLWSTLRDRLGKVSPPHETGDLAYRATVSRVDLDALNDPRIRDMCATKMVRVWLGPQKHAVFYPVKGGEEFNLVLLRPDNLEAGLRTAEGDIGEMRASFAGWDESYVVSHRFRASLTQHSLIKIISCIPTVLKWRLCHHEELTTWVKVCQISKLVCLGVTLTPL